MNIAFVDNNLMSVSIKDNKATIISTQEIGTEIMNFYNYFFRYRLFSEGQLLSLSKCSTNDAIKIINGYPLTEHFFSDYKKELLDSFPYTEDEVSLHALTHFSNLIQRAFSDLYAAFSERPDTGGSDVERFAKSVYLLTHEESEDGGTVFKPNQFSTSIVLLNNKISFVYTVNTLYDYLALDFYYTYFSSETAKKIGLCPYCKKAFRLSQKNNLYCSKQCKDKAIKRNNKRSPYYAKYRYLQQYHNRQLNELRTKKTDAAKEVQHLQEAYNIWHEWARAEYEKANQKYNTAQANKWKLYLDVDAYYKAAADNALPEPQYESADAFAERLKNKWKELSGGIK